ncbi:RagB/SusD family nutrient uptake outer membrane protein [Parapedobacter indicus]|uniref:Starch-binding associating with outer membrane n=1 Tax=Parapedobacter indicus TaxID=1477437 RepID=A0A1I3GPR2_9SPHI|nr:RagB/SusD family nutrient uptake outer membrane protein [Parapedobacter indicus]PPL02737.1 putative outer membrane starch-binding protein [Parapedobacter indicus]SFI25460.1 Starch-binding associating with outer membrane [Parapedobacter indicus]
MKRLFFIIISCVLLWGCSEDYLNRYPLDEISSVDFWKTTKDLELYINQFYPSAFPISGSDRLQLVFASDLSTDDVVPVEADARLRGSRVVPATGGWNYTEIRNVNYFLENYEKVEEPFESYKHFVGEAYFFRAFFYFSNLKAYGDLPWIDQTLNSDSPELYGRRIPRNEIVDLIVSDLDQSIALMTAGISHDRTRLNKEIALLFKSRICLYEGTWEKYHQGTPFGVANAEPEKFLRLAVEAAEELMNLETYSVYTPGEEDKAYFFFGETDYSSHPEVLLWKKYDLALSLGHSRQFQIARGNGGGIGLTKSLIDSYLCNDGRPIILSDGSINPLYNGDGNLISVAENRDPRLQQTIFLPGAPLQVVGGDTTRFTRPTVDNPAHTKNTTGYQVSKTLNYDPVHHNTSETLAVGYSGWIIMRYAEALLNFAEAKAELNTITQDDLNKSVNLLKKRVGMPPLILANITQDPNWLFPELPPVINEIRRERRIELVLEGFRWDDIARWAAAEQLIIGKRPLGAKFNATDYPDLSVTDFRLTNGYFDEYRDILPSGFGFDPARDYLNPISTEELVLNPSLTQNPGW